MLRQPSINTNLVAPFTQKACWMDPIKARLESGWLPNDTTKAQKLQVRALRYALVDGALYKKSYSIPYLRCLRPLDAKSNLREVHEGIYGQHLGGRALAYKIARLGIYFPNMLYEAHNFVKKCERCQKDDPIIRQPPKILTSINSPIPFVM